MTSPIELTEARRAYLAAGNRYMNLTEQIRRFGATERSMAACEVARVNVRRLYAEYLDASATAGMV